MTYLQELLQINPTLITDIIKTGFLGFSIIIMFLSYRLLANIIDKKDIKDTTLSIKIKVIKFFMAMSILVIILGMFWESQNPKVILKLDVQPENIQGIKIKIDTDNLDIKSKRFEITDDNMLGISLYGIEKSILELKKENEGLKNQFNLFKKKSINEVKEDSSIDDGIEVLVKHGKLQEAILIYEEILRKDPNNIKIKYKLALLYVKMKDYKKASNDLYSILLQHGNTSEVSSNIYNILGWTYLMQEDLDQALTTFKIASSPNNYKKLDNTNKMKVSNNTGYTLMLMDRYEEALVQFEQAVKLGSTKAKLNIQKINSIIEVQKNQDINIPGIFLVILKSVKEENKLVPIIEELATKLLVNINDFVIYKTTTNTFRISLGNNYSYNKAEEILKDVKEKGISDAFVTSSTQWNIYEKEDQVKTKIKD